MIKLEYNDLQCEEHYLAVKPVIKRRIENVLLGISRATVVNGRRNGPKAPIILDPELIGFLNNLLIDAELRKLITVKPYDLAAVITYVRAHHPNFFQNGHDSNYVIKNIFIDHAYKNLEKWDFIQRIRLDSCPYCNRAYIYSLSKQGEIKPQIDHFYPSSLYPLLAVSFYNLIPSCQTCNGFGAKEEKDPITEDLINPYLLVHEDFKFTYEILNINVINPLTDAKSVKVKFINKKNGHLKVFKLDQLYEKHADHVLEMIIKSKLKYTDVYRTYLKKYKKLRFSDDEIDRMILGNFSLVDDMHKRPFAKLYQDIGRELGLINS